MATAVYIVQYRLYDSSSNPQRHCKYKQESKKAIFPSLANKLKDTKCSYLASISKT